ASFVAPATPNIAASRILASRSSMLCTPSMLDASEPGVRLADTRLQGHDQRLGSRWRRGPNFWQWGSFVATPFLQTSLNPYAVRGAFSARARGALARQAGRPATRASPRLTLAGRSS